MTGGGPGARLDRAGSVLLSLWLDTEYNGPVCSQRWMSMV